MGDRFEEDRKWVGNGYRALEIGEKVIQGDEFLSGLGWAPSKNWKTGGRQDELLYRRRLKDEEDEPKL